MSAPRSPFAVPAFRALWFAATLSYVGSFVQDVAERWTILELTGSPLLTSLLSTAFVGASLVGMLPAGVLADRRDRRQLVVLSQLVQAATAAILAVLAATGKLTPGGLLFSEALLGLGMAIGSPAWNAIIPEIVPRGLIAEPIALNAIAFNIARAVGPAIGGVVLRVLGPVASFALNALSFGCVVVAILLHRPPPSTRPAPPPLTTAFAEPARFVLREKGVRSAFLAMLLFSTGTSMVYALAPAFAKQALGADAAQYGLLFGAMGLGAVIGTVSLRPLRPRLGPRLVVVMTMTTYAVSAFALSRASGVLVAILLFLPAGAGWTGTFSSLSTLTQLWTPDALRARVVAMYTVGHFAIWATGSALGGVLGERWTVRAAMALGAGLCALAGFVTLRLPLPTSFLGPPASIPPPVAPDAGHGVAS